MPRARCQYISEMRDRFRVPTVEADRKAATSEEKESLTAAKNEDETDMELSSPDRSVSNQGTLKKISYKEDEIKEEPEAEDKENVEENSTLTSSKNSDNKVRWNFPRINHATFKDIKFESSSTVYAFNRS